jgi:hypothetical protein
MARLEKKKQALSPKAGRGPAGTSSGAVLAFALK